MSRNYALPGLRRLALYTMLLLSGFVTACDGSSGAAVDNLLVYDISGMVRDSAGAPLAGVVFTLGGFQTTSGADGAFVIRDVPHGVSGSLVPAKSGISFLPQSHPVVVNQADITAIAFSGFAIAALQDNLPITAKALQVLTLDLKAVDTAGLALPGYTTSVGSIISEPAGVVVITQPQFTDGQATAVVRFDLPGTYTLRLQGFCEQLHAALGTLEVGPADPQQQILHVQEWRHGADAAVSLTFDDGSADHWTRGLALWEEYGFKVTLGILANRFLDHPERIPQLQVAFDAGHELANHSTSHPDLTTQSAAQIQTEIDTCQQLLHDNVSGFSRILTFVYPYEAFNDAVIDVLQEEGILFARSGAQDMVDATSINDAWNPPLYHLYSWANLNTLPMSFWNNTVIYVANHGGWLVEQCHGIGAIGEAGVGWSPRPDSEYREHYELLKSYGDKLWIAPLSEVGRYVVERNLALISLTENSADKISFTLTTGLDAQVYTIPLTVGLALPEGWAGLTARHGGVELTQRVAASGQILFDVVPGATPVELEPTT